jgi:hypothetical protein
MFAAKKAKVDYFYAEGLLVDPRRSPAITGNVPIGAARSTKICDNPHDGGQEAG